MNYWKSPRKSLRLRKKYLLEHERKKYKRDMAAQGDL